MEYIFNLPVSQEEIEKLNAGDRVILRGIIYTARDAAHKRLVELMEMGGELPVELAGTAIYYAGPTPEKPGEVIGSAGPTTSGRMDPYAPKLLDAGLKMMIGKGNRSQEVIDSIVKNHAVYFAAMGGAGALIGSCVNAVDIVCYEDLGCEAIRRLAVKDMPLLVAVDSKGNNIYKSGPETYLKSLEG